MRKFREFSSSSQLGSLLLVRFLFRFVRPFSFFLPPGRLSLRHSTCLNVWFVTFESDERAVEERCTFIKSAFNCSFFFFFLFLSVRCSPVMIFHYWQSSFPPFGCLAAYIIQSGSWFSAETTESRSRPTLGNEGLIYLKLEILLHRKQNFHGEPSLFPPGRIAVYRVAYNAIEFDKVHARRCCNRCITDWVYTGWFKITCLHYGSMVM